jgi:hypothetical protein
MMMIAARFLRVAVVRPPVRLLRTTTTARTTFSSFSTDAATADHTYDGVSPEVSKRIYEHAHQPQTPVSLQTLLQTGRGEFLHKSYKNLIVDEAHDEKDRVATGKVLMQVSNSYYTVLYSTAEY